jgi:hypothetical protein
LKVKPKLNSNVEKSEEIKDPPIEIGFSGGLLFCVHPLILSIKNILLFCLHFKLKVLTCLNAIQGISKARVEISFRLEPRTL